jgi:hypothetical protein
VEDATARLTAGRTKGRRATDLLLAVCFIALQAWLIAPAFAGELTRYRGSIESAYIAHARFIHDHLPDLSWDPLWYLGFPFEWSYTPLLPATVAAIGKIIGSVPSAYRLVAAAGYALGPAAMYLATREVARSRSAAIFAGLVFMVAPSASYVLPALREDAAAFAGAPIPPPWRLVALVEYGEGPHVLSLSLALVALAAAARYVRAPSRPALAGAVLAAVAVALTNLIGVLGAAVFVILLPASRRLGGTALSRWARVLRIGVLAALLSAGWYSAGFIRAVLGYSAGADGSTAYPFLFVALAAAFMAVALSSGRVPEGLELVAGWCLVFAAIVGAWPIWHVAVAPQPIRYALELDAAIAMGIGVGLVALLRRTRAVSSRAALGLATVAGAVLLAFGASFWTATRDRLGPDEAWESWSERTTALWLADHLAPGERAYLSGDHAFWLDVFADVPQVRGGNDFAAADPWWAHAAFQVNTGPDADISVLWMQAFAVRYVVVTGPGSTEVYRDFADPGKFDGRLSVALDRGGLRVYEVPRVGDPEVVIARVADLAAPASAIDRAAIEAYVRRIAAGHAAANLERRGLGAWRAEVDAGDGEGVVLRQAYDAGWHATVDGRPADIRGDPIGHLLVPVPAGRHVVELDHRIHADLIAGAAVAALTALGVIVAVVRGRTRGAWYDRASTDG